MRRKPKVEILKATPCIEGLFLAILQHPKFTQVAAASDVCKREFEANYISADKKTDKRSYIDKFPRRVVEERRAKVPELNAILKAMQV